MNFFRAARALAFAGLALSFAPLPAAAAAPIPVANFFKPGAFGGAVLSPDGQHIAALVSIDGGPRMLVVLPVASRTPKVLVRGTSDVQEVRWVSEKRLAYTLRSRGVTADDSDMGPGLFAIDIDGSDARQLATRSRYAAREGSAIEVRMLPLNTHMNASLGKQDSDTIFVNVIESQFRDGGIVNLARLNTRTGRTETLSRPGKTADWLLDENFEPRIAVTSEGDASALHYRDPASGAWRKLQEFVGHMRDTIDPIAFGPDGKLYVGARNGHDKTGLFTYDIAKGALASEPIMRLQHYDFTGAPIFRNGKLAGISYLAEATSIAWIDEDMKKLQKQVDDKLPSTNNLLSFPRRGDSPYMLVTAYSDVEPGTSFLFNHKTGELSLLGRMGPDIKPDQMASMEPVRYKARDGLEIPAWLTLPQGAQKNLPLVVLVHGGPWVRGGQWGWNREVQFLASRGYAVLQPEARASRGFGWKHFEAGFKQWGQAMQDDQTDGARWAIAQGYADPKRICIAGASYGGYAALMGVLKEPELFKCAIDWVGVSDINLLYEAHWSDSSDAFLTFGMPRLVGDKVKDAAMLKANSPLENADRIRRPLLLAYGASDVRVPLVHGTRFRDAVMRNNPDVEWVSYAGEGHGWALLSNNVDFWTRVEKFLNRNIGPSAK